MATLSVTIGGKSTKAAQQLYKTITTIGLLPENDLTLPVTILGQAAPTTASKRGHSALDEYETTLMSIIKDGKGNWELKPMNKRVPVWVNNKKIKKHNLKEGDIIAIGDAELQFSLHDLVAPESESVGGAETGEGAGTNPSANTETGSSGGAHTTPGLTQEPKCDPGGDPYQKLFQFSLSLLGKHDLEKLLDGLLDAVIDITGADKGFLLLTAGEHPRVAAARSMDQAPIKDPESLLSDSIVRRTIAERKPLIVADAFNDSAFNASESVISLKLMSVMCVPLLDRGSILGILYVGNDSIANRFKHSSLEVLTIFAAQASLILKNAMLMNELRLDNQALRAKLEVQRFGDIIGSCDSMKAVFRRIDKVANTDINVLITGETGTGKELIAREIHRRSNRAKGPFITINCGAVPENLMESEFFGHVRGAFTGATVTRQGKFQAANGGTLFLDEIGEMNLGLQVKILRAIQEKVITKVGDTRAEPVDIRILAATNKDLQEEVVAGRFREDLYYRLNVIAIHLPPLRDREEDIMVIARYMLDKQNNEYNSQIKGFSSAAANAIKSYHWPGNIRQLENKIKRAVLLADKPLIGIEDLDLEPELLRPVMSMADAKELFQRRYINEILARNNGNRAKTARDLQVDPRTVFRHLEKEREQFPGMVQSYGDET